MVFTQHVSLKSRKQFQPKLISRTFTVSAAVTLVGSGSLLGLKQALKKSYVKALIFMTHFFVFCLGCEISRYFYNKNLCTYLGNFGFLSNMDQAMIGILARRSQSKMHTERRSVHDIFRCVTKNTRVDINLTQFHLFTRTGFSCGQNIRPRCLFPGPFQTCVHTRRLFSLPSVIGFRKSVHDFSTQSHCFFHTIVWYQMIMGLFVQVVYFCSE